MDIITPWLLVVLINQSPYRLAAIQLQYLTAERCHNAGMKLQKELTHANNPDNILVRNVTQRASYSCHLIKQ